MRAYQRYRTCEEGDGVSLKADKRKSYKMTTTKKRRKKYRCPLQINFWGGFRKGQTFRHFESNSILPEKGADLAALRLSFL